MRVDYLVAVILDDIGLEDNALAGQGHALPKILILALKNIRQIGVVVGHRGDVNTAWRGNLPKSSGCLDPETADGRLQTLSPGTMPGRRGDAETRRRHGRANSCLRVSVSPRPRVSASCL